jgi:hypothetical protein
MKHEGDGPTCCSPHCCMKALERHGKGIAQADGTFLVQPYHCEDGERVRCPKCRHVWKYAGETTEWVCEGRQRPGSVTPGYGR